MAKRKPLEYLSTLREGEDFRFPYGVRKYMYMQQTAGKHVYFDVYSHEIFRSVIDKEVVRKTERKGDNNENWTII